MSDSNYINSKVFIKYARPYRDEGDEPPIDNVWSFPERPHPDLVDYSTMYVYDCMDGKSIINERFWDGKE